MRKPKLEPNEGTLTAWQVMQGYRKDFGMNWLVFLWKMLRGCFFMADALYKPADPALILEILRQDKTDREKYEKEFHDCDDFTYRLMGVLHENRQVAAMPIFITFVEWYTEGERYGHAVVSFYHEGFVYIIEPQNDRICSVPSNYSLNMICG